MRWFIVSRKHLHSRRTKAALIVMPLFLVGAAFYMTINIMNSPAVGTIKAVTAPASIVQAKPAAIDGFYDGRHVSFSYPPGYKRLEQKLSGNYAEVIGLGGPNMANKQITVGISRDSLANNSGIVFRRQQTDIYKEEKPIKDGLVFSSTKNGFEKAAFIGQGEFLATISVFSPTGYDMESAFKQIISSLEWKQ